MQRMTLTRNARLLTMPSASGTRTSRSAGTFRFPRSFPKRPLRSVKRARIGTSNTVARNAATPTAPRCTIEYRVVGSSMHVTMAEGNSSTTARAQAVVS